MFSKPNHSLPLFQGEVAAPPFVKGGRGDFFPMHYDADFRSQILVCVKMLHPNLNFSANSYLLVARRLCRFCLTVRGTAFTAAEGAEKKDTKEKQAHTVFLRNSLLGFLFESTDILPVTVFSSPKEKNWDIISKPPQSYHSSVHSVELFTISIRLESQM